MKVARPGVRERLRQTTQSPGGGREEPGFSLMGWGLWGGFKLTETSRVSFLHRLDILHQVAIWQKNFKRIVSVLRGVRWKPLSVLSLDYWAWAHLSLLTIHWRVICWAFSEHPLCPGHGAREWDRIDSCPHEAYCLVGEVNMNQGVIICKCVVTCSLWQHIY